MSKISALAVMSLMVVGGMAPHAASARDASRPAPGATQISPHAFPNPYAAPTAAAPSTRDRAADAYSTGFAIGLGAALINKQREEELKQQQKSKQGQK